MKHGSAHDVNIDLVSLPSRERELKRRLSAALHSGAQVAPLAGARIETVNAMERLCLSIVAPLAGARIETDNGGGKTAGNFVAPLAGARIETTNAASASAATAVAPLAGARIETPVSRRP